jgi:hypothetical protein
MTMTITATFEVSDVDELHELITNLRELEPVHLLIDGCVAPDEDQTPPFGIERGPEVPERIEIVPEREAYVSALVLWTRENVTEGPIAEVSNAAMHEVYRRFVMWGVDAVPVAAHLVNITQLNCLRDAYRDATGGAS